MLPDEALEVLAELDESIRLTDDERTAVRMAARALREAECPAEAPSMRWVSQPTEDA